MTTPRVDGPLFKRMVDLGGVVADYHGKPLVRHFGDPQSEYRAATDEAAVFDRSHRARFRVSGRAPLQMLNGVLTGSMPSAPQDDSNTSAGVGTYHTVLTPKGKMISDLWALLLGPEASAGVLLDVPVAGRDQLEEHFSKVIPPRFARVEDVTGETGSISVVGPRAAAELTRLALGLRVEAEALSASAEGTWWRASTDPEALVVMRTEEVWPPAFTVYGRTGDIDSLWQRLHEAGVSPAGLGVWSTLRVEAGRPVFGTDMDERTIPIEAGIHDRAIDYNKGCYTGQEVIVRIRDRGHVNRHLRSLELGEGPTPSKGLELFVPGDAGGKVVGTITSAVQSPRRGGVLALAYVRRGVEAIEYDGKTIAVPTDS